MLSDNLKINMNIADACRKIVKRLNIPSTCVSGNDLKYPLTSDQIYGKMSDTQQMKDIHICAGIARGSSRLLMKLEIEIVNTTPTNLMGLHDNFN
jgi:hypothetical protein